MQSPVQTHGTDIHYFTTKWRPVDFLLSRFLRAGRDLLRDAQGRESIRQHALQPENGLVWLDISLSMHVHGRSRGAPPR